MVVCSYSPSTWELEAGGSLESESFKTSNLGNIARLHLKWGVE
jgi:hypothetical protein